MRFETNSSEWINEVKSYLTDGSKKVGDVKKILKATDLSKISYEDKVRLSKLFDPTSEISDELFKRQLDLYFSLLESKSAPKIIPVFSDYIEWVYGQDTSKIPDKIFDMMTSRLMKSKTAQLPETISLFMTKLVQEYNNDIDKISNTRLGTLINVLRELGIDYEHMPQECQYFICRMFSACAVKTEIADKNKKEFRGLFRADPKTYYNLFNKAFAGYDQYETWIDEPAKKLTLKNMINYANYQESVLRNCRDKLYFLRFQSCAKELKLPRLPQYDESRPNFQSYYLQQPREYKDYAKKMSDLFVQMVESETVKFTEQKMKGVEGSKESPRFAYTHKMARNIERVNQITNPFDSGLRYANLLIDFVHLDELTGQSRYNIVNMEKLKNDCKTIEKPSAMQIGFGQITINDLESNIEITDSQQAEEISTKALNGDMKELNDLYEKYNLLTSQGRRDLTLEARIVDLEEKLNDMRGEELETSEQEKL